MATRYGTYTFDAELDCDWMTVDVDITFTLKNDGEYDYVSDQYVMISKSDVNLSKYVNWDYIDGLIDEFVSSGDQKDYGDG
tara:strand:+ start:271 stop:513 length:243 start_codon:yes stop_codon:yes gene_type:complete